MTRPTELSVAALCATADGAISWSEAMGMTARERKVRTIAFGMAKGGTFDFHRGEWERPKYESED